MVQQYTQRTGLIALGLASVGLLLIPFRVVYAAYVEAPWLEGEIPDLGFAAIGGLLLAEVAYAVVETLAFLAGTNVVLARGATATAKWYGAAAMVLSLPPALFLTFVPLA
jgi:hypothetical protein